MKTFFISDTHFDHINVIKYDNRPFRNIEEMQDQLIQNWNNIVGKDDTVWFLGDFMLTNKYEKVERIINQLQGHKKMIRGNHDRLSDEAYRKLGFEFVSKYPVVLKHHFILSHAPIPNFEKDNNFYYIYGHVHNHPDYKDQTCNSTCVCCNRWDYKPIEIDAFNNWKQ